MAEDANLNYQATDLEKEIIGVKAKAPDSTNPDETREKLQGIEDGVLGKIRDRERSWASRLGTFGKYLVPTAEGEKITKVGDFKVKIKEVASERAMDVIGRMSELEGASKKKLHILGRKSAEKLAGMTQRISVAKEARKAAQEYHELIKDEQAERAEIAKYVNAQIAGGAGWKSKIPLRSSLILWKMDREKPKLTGAEDHILTKAANEVESAANIEKREYDLQTKERFKNIRNAEAALRKHILRYSPASVDVIELYLRECASGDEFNLTGLIQNMKLDNYPEKQQKEIRHFLNANVKVLMGREWELSKAFEVLGRIELQGQSSTEVMSQLASLPLGTHVDIKTNEGEYNMVLEAKNPEGRLVLKKLESNQSTDKVILIPDKKIGLRSMKRMENGKVLSLVEKTFSLEKATFSLAA